MRRRIRTPALLAALVVALALTGCNRDRPDQNAGGTGGAGQGGSTPAYNIGGTITGLTASGLSLGIANNVVSVAAGATAFTLPHMVATGTSYTVTVQSQPQGQTCALANASGTVGQANMTNIQATCTTNTYSIGGTITGLSASGLVLSNGSDMLTVSTAASTFLFPTKMPAGTAYAVAVAVQPIGLNCQVINAAGAMPFAAVTNVTVACGQWAWVSGSGQTGAAGTYGTEGMPAAANVPGARAAATSWIDSSGDLWLFGGTGANGDVNDLWKYSPGAGVWTWVSGSNSANASGHYGVAGVAAAGSVPGARAYANSWADSSGNLWIFGGQGYDSAGATGSLNDLWEYNISANQWTWISGSDTAWAPGAAPPGGEPGGRTGAVTWIDAAGSLWLFGGMGTQGLTNDLWKFIPSTTQWTLQSGSQTANAVGIYGTAGTAAAGNVPGSRAQAVASMDAAGDLWLFGGSGYGSIGSTGLLNDLWKFDPTTTQWTWVSGWKTVNAAGVYGTHSTTDVKEPGARFAASAATDAAGNLWLFGGVGYDVAGTKSSLNDMWEYKVGTAQWVWMGGSQTAGTAGVYGTQVIAATGNVPGERSVAVSWMDGSGNFWLFGGQGWGAAKATGMLNDLWQFVP